MVSSDFADLVHALLARLSISWASIIILGIWIGYRRIFTPKRLPYPPGPKPSIFVGNVKDFPEKQPWLTFTEWRKVYGDIIHLELLGQHYVILNSLEAAKELLEKRSSIYSDRPRYVLLEMMEFHKNTPFLPYGATWRKHRNMFQPAIIRASGLHSLRPIHIKKTNDFLYNLLTSPEGFLEHSKTLSAAIIMAIVYGHDIAPQNDIFVEVSEVVLQKLGELVVSKVSLILNAYPVLRFIPSWFPGFGAKRIALQGREESRRMHDLPFKMVEKQMENGAAKPSIVSNLLSNSNSEEDSDLIKEMAVAAYGGGADTTASILGIFFYLMLTHPVVQAKAQQEIDAVVGADCLSTLEDRESIPYIDAVLKEVLRFRPIVPLGLFHSTSQDDIFNSYHIPKGASIAANIWAIHHDPTLYPDPEKFTPERFLNENGALRDDLEVRNFGFGRRVCVGQNLADEVLWLAMANILHVFNITPKKDTSGSDIIPEAKYADTGAFLRILPFECSIMPRPKISEHLIKTISAKKDD